MAEEAGEAAGDGIWVDCREEAEEGEDRLRRFRNGEYKMRIARKKSKNSGEY